MLMRSKVIWGQVGRKGWKWKICYLGVLWKVEVRLEPNLVYGYRMGTFICWWGQAEFLELFLCELLWYWSSLKVTATLPGGSRKLLAVFFLYVAHYVLLITMQNRNWFVIYFVKKTEVHVLHSVDSPQEVLGLGETNWLSIGDLKGYRSYFYLTSIASFLHHVS